VKGEEFLDGSVISFFDVVGKITGGQLVLTPVVGHALTADPLAGAGIIGAIAMLLIGFDLAFHLCHCLGFMFLTQPQNLLSLLSGKNHAEKESGTCVYGASIAHSGTHYNITYILMRCSSYSLL
jgi:hypothetical protein